MADARVMASGRTAALAVLVGVSCLLSACSALPKRGPAPLVMTPPACADFSISIYFDAGSAGLTREAADLIRVAGTRTLGCKVSTVEVIGLADAPGDPDVNLQLSKRRADAVTRALAKRGFGIVSFQVGAAGDVGARTPIGEVRPLRRRADVMFHLSPKI